jgi:hypothetical protein
MLQGVERMEQSTIDKVTEAYRHHGSYRKTALALGVSHGVVYNVIKGKHKHVSLDAENQLRLTLGLPILPPRIEIPACEDCGSAHHGRCHNKNVILRPVIKRREPSRWRDLPPERLAAAIKYREPV